MACSTRSRTDVRLSLALLAALACFAVATPAEAAGGKAAAKKAAKAGKRAFDLGRFDEALKQYEQAYELHPAAALFFNIGQCHRQLGNEERAVFFFRRYLESKPPAGQAKATQALIEQLETARAEKRRKADETAQAARQVEVEQARLAAANAEAAAAAEKRRVGEEEGRRAAEAAEAAKRQAARNPAVEAALVTPPPEAQQDVPVTKRWWFWTAIGAAVAAGVGTGVYLGTAPRPTPTTYPDINGR